MVGSKHNYSCRLHMFWYTGHSFVCVWIHPRDGACPNWWILLTLICQFIYQHADGSDGPQARRLKCGSALGELVDHGADAIVTGLFPYAMAELTGLGVDSPYFILMLLGGYMAFFTRNMTLLHTETQEFQDMDAQEAQQAGQLFLLVLYCYNVYNGIDGRGLYQRQSYPFRPLFLWPNRRASWIRSSRGTITLDYLQIVRRHRIIHALARVKTMAVWAYQ